MPATSPHLDVIALAWFAVLLGGYQFIAGRRWMVERSIVGAIQGQRLQWMRNMAVRDPRIMDSMLLGNLGQGNAFFASTAVIAVGGLTALLGTGERVQRLLEILPGSTRAGPLLFELKILLLIAIFIYAFFKYAWAYRLSQYAYIMVGATPILDGANESVCSEHAERTARLVGIAAEHANSGLRAFYCAIAALAWIFHPLAFMVATAWVLVILVRRDYFSRSRRVIAGDGAPASRDAGAADGR
jgi:uncharacterized membrane protein